MIALFAAAALADPFGQLTVGMVTGQPGGALGVRDEELYPVAEVQGGLAVWLIDADKKAAWAVTGDGEAALSFKIGDWTRLGPYLGVDVVAQQNCAGCTDEIPVKSFSLTYAPSVGVAWHQRYDGTAQHFVSLYLGLETWDVVGFGSGNVALGPRAQLHWQFLATWAVDAAYTHDWLGLSIAHAL